MWCRMAIFCTFASMCKTSTASEKARMLLGSAEGSSGNILGSANRMSRNVHLRRSALLVTSSVCHPTLTSSEVGFPATIVQLPVYEAHIASTPHDPSMPPSIRRRNSRRPSNCGATPVVMWVLSPRLAGRGCPAKTSGTSSSIDARQQLKRAALEGGKNFPTARFPQPYSSRNRTTSPSGIGRVLPEFRSLTLPASMYASSG